MGEKGFNVPMALILTEEQQLIRESARGFLADKAPIGQLRHLRDTKDEVGFSRKLWQDMTEMGWTGIVVPEEYGGLDYGYVGAGLILEEMGRKLTASPLFSTAILGVTAVARLGSERQKNDLLPAIASGRLIVALAIDESAHHNPADIALEAHRKNNAYVLNGNKSFVIDGHVADKLIVPARTSGTRGQPSGLTFFVIDADTTNVSIQRSIMVDSRNAARVEFTNVEIGAEQVLGPPDQAFDDLEYILDVGRICLAAEMLGIAQEVFEQTVQYLRERKQFGVPIGSFQALQHRAATLFCDIELCKSVVLKALQGIDEKSNLLPALASLAKAKTGEATRVAVNEAIQMHGGMGMTDEFDMGFFIKRAEVARQTFGDPNFHADRLARLNGY